ncbi:MAG: recombinase RecT [Bacteroidota bacterium]
MRLRLSSIDIGLSSGRVQSFMAQVVREGDVFEYEFGLNDKLRHVPLMGERGEITHAYAYARFRNGGYVFEVLPRADIDAVMNKSKSKDKDGKISGPWKTNYEPMARKTMVRRLAKYVPLSVEFARAVALDEVALRGQSQNLDVANIDTHTGEIAESEFSLVSEEEEGTSFGTTHATDGKQKDESLAGSGQQR